MKIKLLSYPCGWGARNKQTGLGPEYLQQQNIQLNLKQHNIDARWELLYHSQLEPKNSQVVDARLRHRLINDYCSQLEAEVERTIQSQYFPVCIGGDHSIALGTWGGVSAAHHMAGHLGLIWVDAHMDAHSLQTSDSGNLHGMPLNFLIEQKIIAPEHLVLIGVRSFEASEQQYLQQLNVKIYYMEEVKQRGFATLFTEAVDYVTQTSKGFGISIDIDAFEPTQAPATDYLAPDGIQTQQAIKALQGIGHHPLLRGLEIAEFNPELDKKQMTENFIVQLLTSAFVKPRSGS